MRYTLRLQFGPNLDTDLVRKELLQLCANALADEVMFFLFAEEQNNGHETLDEIRDWLALIRPWKEAVEAAGLTVSLNPWHTILHCDRDRRLKPGQSWQTMVDWQGRSTEAVVCPLDPGWQDYYRQSLALYAAEHFRVIWVDDDIRLHNHAPLDWGGCFCPLHMAEFNRRTGAGATREELVARVTQPGTPHPWRDAWLDMWDETQLALIESFRKVVAPFGVRLGLMSSRMEAHAMEGRRWQAWWRALAGDEAPVHRPHFAGYSDGLGSQLPRLMATLDMNRRLEPAGSEVGPEIENFPYGWSKSYRQTACQMVMATVAGSDSFNLSLYDFLGNLPSDDRTRETFLANWKPALTWLGQQFPPALRSQGIGCPWNEEMSRRKSLPASSYGRWPDLACEVLGWANWLGTLGHACQTAENATINALVADAVWASSDAELRRMLGAGLLLDGPAAFALVERGFGRWLGLTDLRFITQHDALFSLEEMTDPAFSLRPGAQVTMNTAAMSARVLQGRPAAGSRIVSRLLDPKQREVGHGVVVSENELGGRVAICPWDAKRRSTVRGSSTRSAARRSQRWCIIWRATAAWAL